MPQVPSTRWCPTPEQLMILEEMYRSGVRTPNASQIQQITAHLSYYGKIEGKNVFYWFQNHKARDRQKLRRRLSRHQQMLQQHQINQQAPQLNLMDPSNSSLHQHYIPHQIPPQFLQQGCYPEAPEAMNLVSKLETCEREDEAERSAAAACSVSYGHEWNMVTGGSSAVPHVAGRSKPWSSSPPGARDSKKSAAPPSPLPAPRPLTRCSKCKLRGTMHGTFSVR